MAVSEFKGVSSKLCNEMNDLKSSLASIAASLAALSNSKKRTRVIEILDEASDSNEETPARPPRKAKAKKEKKAKAVNNKSTYEVNIFTHDTMTEWLQKATIDKTYGNAVRFFNGKMKGIDLYEMAISDTLGQNGFNQANTVSHIVEQVVGRLQDYQKKTSKNSERETQPSLWL